MTGEVTIRRAVLPDDEAAIVTLLRQTMGWAADDQAEQLFRWKHLLNPAGTSPMWLGEQHGDLVGLRAFLRWAFIDGDRAVRAVRAVDTVTHPDHRGKGLFTRLTLCALAEMAGEGVDFVFNTPNAQSLPGYKKMGWQEIGALPMLVRIRSIGAIPKVLRSRGPADLGSLPCTVGQSAAEAFADHSAVDALLGAVGPRPGLHTAQSVEFLRWRYVDAPLGYRVLTGPGGVSEGFVVFRLRRRVRAIEATIADVIVPRHDRQRSASLIKTVANQSGADYAIMLSDAPRAGRWIRMGGGPLLAARTVTTAPPPILADWSLTLGDVELF